MNSSSVQQCTILKLPAELLTEVANYVFCETRLTFGDVDLDGELSEMTVIPRITRPRPHSLALLYVCREFHDVCRDSWMSFVLFNFDSPNALLATLLPRGEPFISRVRYISILHSRLWLRYPDASEPWFYESFQYMKLLPGLQLDTLYIIAGSYEEPGWKDFEGSWYRPVDFSHDSFYQLVGDMVRFGTGWRQLEVHLPRADIFTAGHENENFHMGYDGLDNREDIAVRWMGKPKWIETSIEFSLKSLAPRTSDDKIQRRFSEDELYEAEKQWLGDITAVQAGAWNSKQRILRPDYDRRDFGIDDIYITEPESEKILQRPLMIKIARTQGDLSPHGPMYPDPGYDPPLASIVERWLDDNDTVLRHAALDPRTWLTGLTWQEIRTRYIDGTELEYGTARSRRLDSSYDNELAWKSNASYDIRYSKALSRRALDETRQHNLTICYDEYDDIFDFSDAWVNYLEGGIDKERMALKKMYVKGDESYLWDEEWLERIGAVHYKLPESPRESISS